MKKRKSAIIRKTRETDITVDLNLDGRGKYSISTGVGFMDHMLELLTKHSMTDLKLKARGDTHVDYHHTTEDIGLTLGTAIDKALGTRAGIVRYGFGVVPMDEAIAEAVVDLGGRPYLVMNMSCKKKKILDFDLGLVEEFFRALTVQGRFNLHISQAYGKDAHHAYEAVFKAVARALRVAFAYDPLSKGIPSTKGTL